MVIACVLRASKEYDAEYVRRLRDGVAKNLKEKHRFVCLSDVDVPCERIELKHGWPVWWSKMELFRPDIGDDILYFDLDTLIVGDLKDIASVRSLTMLSDFYQGYPASGVMYLPWFERAEVWRRWIKCPDRHRTEQGGNGDGGFLRYVFGKRPARWQDEVPGQIVSYKKDVKGNGIPENARVICFHGRPRPRDLNWTI